MPSYVGNESLWKRGMAEPAGSGGMCGSVGARCRGTVDMAADGDGNGAPCIIDDSDGMGDGEGGNEIWVIGTPMDDGCGGDSPAPAMVARVLEGDSGGWYGGPETYSEAVGPDAGSAGMPP